VIPRVRVALATRNPGKLAEFRRLFAGQPWELVGLDAVGFSGSLTEPGATYEENAVAKAEAVLAATGTPAIADDSGLEVPGLGDWPGPQSARWMGPDASDGDRIQGLLSEVERRSPGDRRARFVCVLALARPGEEPIRARGETWGVLVPPRGSQGFGYDPAFLSDDLGMTFGEASAAAKARVSHRSRAVAALLGAAGPRLGLP